MVLDIALGIVLAVIILAFLPLAIYVGAWAILAVTAILSVYCVLWLLGFGFGEVTTRWPWIQPWITGAFAVGCVIYGAASIVITIRKAYRENPRRVRRESATLACLLGLAFVLFLVGKVFPSAAIGLMVGALFAVLVAAVWLQRLRSREDAASGSAPG